MKELMAALNKARSEMADPRKSATNPAFRSKYVPRDEALDAVMPALLANGLMLVQYPVTYEDTYGVGSKLVHTSGQEMDCGVFTVRPAKNDPQGAVAATTYASRCALMLLFGIAGDEDDDGNHASGKTNGCSNAPVRRENAPHATKTPEVVQPTAPQDIERQNALNEVTALGKRAMANGVEAGQITALAKKLTGMAVSECDTVGLKIIGAAIKSQFLDGE